MKNLELEMGVREMDFLEKETICGGSWLGRAVGYIWGYTFGMMEPSNQAASLERTGIEGINAAVMMVN
jgi:hypothetical protein